MNNSQLESLAKKVDKYLSQKLEQKFKVDSKLECEYEKTFDQIYFSMARSGEGAAKKASEEYGIEHLGTLPLDPRVITLSDEGTPFVIKEPDTKVAHAFSELVDKLADKVGLV